MQTQKPIRAFPNRVAICGKTHDGLYSIQQDGKEVDVAHFIEVAISKARELSCLTLLGEPYDAEVTA